MTTQLRLIDANEVEWRLDEHVKEVGRRGLARARAALVAAQPLRPEAACRAASERGVSAPARARDGPPPRRRPAPLGGRRPGCHNYAVRHE